MCVCVCVGGSLLLGGGAPCSRVEVWFIQTLLMFLKIIDVLGVVWTVSRTQTLQCVCTVSFCGRPCGRLQLFSLKSLVCETERVSSRLRLSSLISETRFTLLLLQFDPVDRVQMKHPVPLRALVLNSVKVDWVLCFGFEDHRTVSSRQLEDKQYKHVVVYFNWGENS